MLTNTETPNNVPDPTDTPAAPPKKRGGGPKTPEGKARSRMNALRHGMTSKLLVLSVERDEVYKELERDYVNRFRPVDGVERDLVDDMIVARWHHQRMLLVETGLFELEMARGKAEELDKDFPGLNDQGRLAYAFAHLSDFCDGTSLINRYHSHWSRTYDRAIKNLAKLRRDYPPGAGPGYEEDPETEREAAAIIPDGWTQAIAALGESLKPENRKRDLTPAAPEAQQEEAQTEGSQPENTPRQTNSDPLETAEPEPDRDPFKPCHNGKFPQFRVRKGLKHRIYEIIDGQQVFILPPDDPWLTMHFAKDGQLRYD